jgi:uncharacterized protein YjbJ (UPF0337 family)
MSFLRWWPLFVSRERLKSARMPRFESGAQLVEFLLALGGLLVVEAGGAALAPPTLLGRIRPSFMLLRGLCVLLGECSLLCRALAFPLGAAVSLRCLGGVGLGFLTMVRRLARQTSALLATALGQALHSHRYQGDHDKRPDHDGDDRNSGHLLGSTPSHIHLCRPSRCLSRLVAPIATRGRESMMRSKGRDKAGGTLDKLRGRVKEASGALRGKEGTKAKGQARQAKGSARKKRGHLRDALRK